MLAQIFLSAQVLAALLFQHGPAFTVAAAIAAHAQHNQRHDARQQQQIQHPCGRIAARHQLSHPRRVFIHPFVQQLVHRGRLHRHAAGGHDFAFQHRAGLRRIARHAQNVSLADGRDQRRGKLKFQPLGQRIRQLLLEVHVLPILFEVGLAVVVGNIRDVHLQIALVRVVLRRLAHQERQLAVVAHREHFAERNLPVLGKAIVAQADSVGEHLRIRGVVLGRVQAHGDQRHAVLLRRAHKAAPRGIGIAGLYTDARRVIQLLALKQQVVFGGIHLAVGIQAADDRMLLASDDLAELPILHRVRRKRRQVARGRIVVGALVAVRVFIVRSRHAQLLRLLVHRAHKRRFAAAHQHGHGNGGVVAGGDHHAIQKIVKQHRFPGGNAHSAGAGRNLDSGRNRNLPSHQIGFQRQNTRHDLGGAGRVAPLIGLLLKQHVSRVCVDQDAVRAIQMPGIQHVRRASVVIRRLNRRGDRRERDQQRAKQRRRKFSSSKKMQRSFLPESRNSFSALWANRPSLSDYHCTMNSGFCTAKKRYVFLSRSLSFSKPYSNSAFASTHLSTFVVPQFSVTAISSRPSFCAEPT